MYSNVKFGADPELFLVDKDGRLRSAIGLIGGTKENPRPIDGEGSAVQEDNVAVEFNIAPAMEKKEFVQNIGKVIRYLDDFVSEKQLRLHFVASAMFPDEELRHPKAVSFGCDPDYCIWTMRENPAPEMTKETMNLRSAGGHLHVSWDKPNNKARATLVKALDIFCGAPAIQYDSDIMRRKLYGKAGACRPKEYGVEYRTLSNFWIRSPDLVEWVFDQASKAIDYLNAGGKIKSEHKGLIFDCINNGNEASLHKLQNLYPI